MEGPNCKKNRLTTKIIQASEHYRTYQINLMGLINNYTNFDLDGVHLQHYFLSLGISSSLIKEEHLQVVGHYFDKYGDFTSQVCSQ